MVRSLALIAGPAAFVAFSLFQPASLGETASCVAGLVVWMAVWWSTEAIPVPITALLPIIVLPPAGVSGIGAAAAPYAHPLIFLFLGGFLLAHGVQRWNLHRRIALALILRFGFRPRVLLASFMAMTGFVSMWVSNTATAMLMLPIAISVTAEIRGNAASPDRRDAFTTALLLGVAYGASIGGMATLIGTPPNALLAAFAQASLGIRIGFAEWMMIGLPVAALLGTCAWFILAYVAFRLPSNGDLGARERLQAGLASLGRRGSGETRVAIVFVLTAAAWIAQPLLRQLPGMHWLSDASIALIGGSSLFVVSAGGERGEKLLDWSDAARLPWGTLILFGGGLSLAEAITRSGLAESIGNSLGVMSGWGAFAVVALIATIVVFLSEIASNTAATSALLPITAALAASLGIDPMLLMASTVLAASCGFMLPVATPPNAIVYATGNVAMVDMLRVGLLLNVAGIVVISLLLPLLIPG
ncbi:MAG: DASS family sodium-coupled anion symporter [Alphaproteobacteria bacterium]